MVKQDYLSVNIYIYTFGYIRTAPAGEHRQTACMSDAHVMTLSVQISEPMGKALKPSIDKEEKPAMLSGNTRKSCHAQKMPLGRTIHGSQTGGSDVGIYMADY